MGPADDDAPIFLIGFMASGKTTIGRLLAERLDWAFVDLDKVIEDEAEKTVAGIFAAEGEAGFRKRETEALKQVAARRKTVIATGGGAPCREENLGVMLASGRVFWLRVSSDVAVARAGKASGRPLLDGAADPVEAARQLAATRRPFYARAHASVETDGLSPKQIVDEILTTSMVIGVLAEEEAPTR
jgi:shikimate kinase